MPGQLPRCNPRQRRAGDIRWQPGVHQEARPARNERRGKAARGGTVSGEGASGGDASGGGVTGDEAAWPDLESLTEPPGAEGPPGARPGQGPGARPGGDGRADPTSGADRTRVIRPAM